MEEREKREQAETRDEDHPRIHSGRFQCASFVRTGVFVMMDHSDSNIAVEQ